VISSLIVLPSSPGDAMILTPLSGMLPLTILVLFYEAFGCIPLSIAVRVFLFSGLKNGSVYKGKHVGLNSPLFPQLQPLETLHENGASSLPREHNKLARHILFTKRIWLASNNHVTGIPGPLTKRSHESYGSEVLSCFTNNLTNRAEVARGAFI
jgi:hypothetical protein